MPRGQLFINGYDAHDRWGLSMDSTALSALMTPSGTKDNLKSVSRAADGQVVSRSNVRVASRTISVVFQICANTEAEFFSRYESFCEELAKGFLYVTTSFQSSVCYRFEYNQCSQFTQFMRGIAKFTLKLTENNPTKRLLPSATLDTVYKIGSATCKKSGTFAFTRSQLIQYRTSGFDLKVVPNCSYEDIDSCAVTCDNGTLTLKSKAKNEFVFHFTGTFSFTAVNDYTVKFKNNGVESVEHFSIVAQAESLDVEEALQ